MPACLIGLGSNQGDRQATLDAAAARLAATPQIKLLGRSRWRETAPVGGPPGQQPFLNGALKLETALGPHELLACLRQIEDALGRRRDQRWGPRTLDLDLLLYDELILDTPALALPHPRMAYRRFVLEPATEVAGAMVHPTIRWTVAQLLRHLDASARYVAMTGPIAVGKTWLAGRLAAAIPGRLLPERPDWPMLDAFYADPLARGLATELKFLAQRAELLSAGDRRWMEPGWTVGDFWFDQSAAFARAWLPAEQLPAFLERHELLRSTVARPRLIVLLDLPAEELLQRLRRRGRPCERRLTIDQLERIRRSVVEQAARPKLGPVLRLGHADSEAALAEVLAAVRGME